MKRPDVVERDYSKSDSDLLAQADIFLAHLTEDLTYFTGFDAMFNAAYVTNFQAKIEAGYDCRTDQYWIDVVNQKTQLFGIAVDESKDMFFTTEFFADKLEKTIPGVKGKMGYNDYAAAQHSQTKFVNLIGEFHDVVVEYSTELLGVGFTQEQIDKVGTIADKIRSTHKDQEKAKKDRKMATIERIKKLNEIWAIMTEIAKAAKIIFAADIAHYERYLLYEQESSSGTTTLEGTVPAGQTVIVKDDVIPENVFKLKNPGSTVLDYCSGEDEIPCTDATKVNPGEETEVTAADMGSGTKLKVTNVSEDADGAYEVEVI